MLAELVWSESHPISLSRHSTNRIPTNKIGDQFRWVSVCGGIEAFSCSPPHHILFLTRLFYSQKQLKPITSQPVISSITDFLPTLRKWSWGKRGDWLLNIRKTWQHPNGAEMVRKPAPKGGDEQAPNSPVCNQSTQPQLPGRCSFEIPTSVRWDEGQLVMTHLSPPLKLKHDKLKVLPSEPTTLLPLEKHSVVISASTHSFLIPGASSPSLHPWGAQPPLIPYSLTHKRAIFFF